MLSAAEVVYSIDGIRQGIRSDGRACDVIRPFSIQMGVVSTANGSCRILSSACDIYVAIKCEIVRPRIDKPDEGIVTLAVDFSSSAVVRQQELSMRQASLETESMAEVFANQLSSLCLSSLDKQQFCIKGGDACWKLSVDVLVERLDIPLIDPSSVGIRAAFMDLQLPVVAVPAEDHQVDGDEPESAIPRVDLMGGLWRPRLSECSALCVSVGVFSDNSVMVVDLDSIEEYLARQMSNCLIVIAVDGEGKCSGLHKYGIGAIDPCILRDVVSAGMKVGRQISSTLQKHSLVI